MYYCWHISFSNQIIVYKYARDEEYNCNSCNTLKVKSVFILKVICYLIPLILSPVSCHAPELPT